MIRSSLYRHRHILRTPCMSSDALHQSGWSQHQIKSFAKFKPHAPAQAQKKQSSTAGWDSQVSTLLPHDRQQNRGPFCMQQTSRPFPVSQPTPGAPIAPLSQSADSSAHFVFFTTTGVGSGASGVTSGAALTGALLFGAFFTPCHSSTRSLSLPTLSTTPQKTHLSQRDIKEGNNCISSDSITSGNSFCCRKRRGLQK